MVRRQEGVFARKQLLDWGVEATAIRRAVNAGRLYRIHAGVYSVVPPELLSDDGHLIAALMAAGKGAVLSHDTAAWRLKLIKWKPVQIHASVPRSRKDPEGVRLHVHGEYRPGDVIRHGRFLMTAPARTALDVAEDYPLRWLLDVLAQAEFHHDLRPAEVDAVRRRGHPGSARLGEALRLHVPGYGIVLSELEELFRLTLIEANVPLPDRNVRVGDHRCDCIWESRRVIVELDGRQHERPRQADLDDDRDLDTRAERFVTRRFGYRQVKARPADVVADVLRAFEEATLLRYVCSGPGEHAMCT